MLTPPLLAPPLQQVEQHSEHAAAPYTGPSIGSKPSPRRGPRLSVCPFAQRPPSPFPPSPPHTPRDPLSHCILAARWRDGGQPSATVCTKIIAVTGPGYVLPILARTLGGALSPQRDPPRQLDSPLRWVVCYICCTSLPVIHYFPSKCMLECMPASSPNSLARPPVRCPAQQWPQQKLIPSCRAAAIWQQDVVSPVPCHARVHVQPPVLGFAVSGRQGPVSRCRTALPDCSPAYVLPISRPAVGLP